jgi:hypothetical protein
MSDDRPVPPITEALREQARRQPGGWMYAVDPAFDPDGAVPPHGVIGAWKVDGRGEITGEFRHNPHYRPSPAAMGLSAPTDPLDEAAQLAAAGHGSVADVIDRLLDREVYLVDDDRPVVEVFSDPAHLPPDAAGRARLIAGFDVAGRVGLDRAVEVNPGGGGRVRVSGAELADAIVRRNRQ